MDFTLSDEQQALRDSVDRFAARDYGWEQRGALLRTGGPSPVHWATFADLGWLGAGLPEEADGFGGGAVADSILLEAFGRALVVEPLVPHIVAANLLSRATGEEPRRQLAAMVAGERRIVLAHSEGAMHDAGIEASLTISTEGFRLEGVKTLVQGGDAADMLVVSARRADNGDLALCLVDREASGVERHEYRMVDNHRAADFRFDGVLVETDSVLAFPDGTDAVLDVAQDRGIVALCAEAVGAMDAALWITRDHLLARHQFGVPLATFQALRHRMADMLIESQMARSLLFHALAHFDDDSEAIARERAVSAAKARIGAAGVVVAGGAIQLHGGIGMTEEYIVGHYYKRLFAIARLMGSEEIHLRRFAAATDRMMAGDPDAL